MDESAVCYGDKIQLNDEQTGTVKYIGSISIGDPTNGKNKPGIYYGIHLSTKTGSHNGTVKGRKYFLCPPKHGIFVRLKDISSIIKMNKNSSTRYHMNQRVLIKNQKQLGRIKYIGLCEQLDTNLNNSNKLWFGIELNAQQSQNKYYQTGTIGKVQFFKPNRNCNAIFVQQSNLGLPPSSKSLPPPKIPPPPAPKKPITFGSGKKLKSDDRRDSVFDKLKKKMMSSVSSTVSSETSDDTLDMPQPKVVQHKESQRTKKAIKTYSKRSKPTTTDAAESKGRPRRRSRSRDHIDYKLNKNDKEIPPKRKSDSNKRKNNEQSQQKQQKQQKRMKPKRSCDKCLDPNCSHKHKRNCKRQHCTKCKCHRRKKRGGKTHRKKRSQSYGNLAKQSKMAIKYKQGKNDKSKESKGKLSKKRPSSSRYHARSSTKEEVNTNSFISIFSPRSANTEQKSTKPKRPKKPPPPRKRGSYTPSAPPRPLCTALPPLQQNSISATSPSNRFKKKPDPLSKSRSSPRYSDQKTKDKPPPLNKAKSSRIRPIKQSKAKPVSKTMSRRGPSKNSSNGRSTNNRSNSLVTKMMNVLPFSTSTDAEDPQISEVDDDFIINKKGKKTLNNRKSNKSKGRSRTRDVGSIATKINSEEAMRRKNGKMRRLVNKSYAGRSSGKRSQSLEINAADLMSEEEEELTEYSFSSSGNDQESTDDDSELDSKDEEDEALSLFVGTWNVGEIDFVSDEKILSKWLGANTNENIYAMHDVYVIGLQECVSQHRKAWINGILNYLDYGKKQYIVLQKMHLMNIMCIVIVNRLYISRIRDIKCKTVACGKGNIIGNKGAVAITMKFDESTFAFINVHLVARAERVMQRMENIERIFKSIDGANMGQFQNIDALNQFHHVIFFGDLNYRITKGFYQVCDLMKKKQYRKFAKYDQLYHQMKTNEILYSFHEGNISSFPPSYRWDRDRNIVSNKREQPPSYTDRILYKSLPNCHSFWQTKYKSCMKCFGSDHRPIMGTFKFVPHELPRHTKKSKKFETIEIGFYELRAFFDLSKKTESKTHIKNLDIDENDELICNMYYGYCNNNGKSTNVQKLSGGHYDEQQKCFMWSLDILDKIKIVPYILNPEFITSTYVHLQIVNASKYNSLIGYSVISLFNIFPSSLVDREKIMKKYNNPQLPALNDSISFTTNDSLRKERRHKLSDKEFTSPITIHGTYIGDIKGFIHAQSELVEKHRKISAKQKYK